MLLFAQQKQKGETLHPTPLQFVNIGKLSVIGKITIDGAPEMAVMSPSGEYIYLMERGQPSNNPAKNVNGSIRVIAMNEMKVTAVLDAGSDPKDLFIDEAAGQVLQLSEGAPVKGQKEVDGELRVIRGASIASLLPIAAGPRFIRFSPDRKRIYAVCAKELSAIDYSSLHELGRIRGFRFDRSNALAIFRLRRLLFSRRFGHWSAEHRLGSKIVVSTRRGGARRSMFAERLSIVVDWHFGGVRVLPRAGGGTAAGGIPANRQMLVEGERDGWTNVPPEMLLEMKREQVVITTNGVDVANPVVLKKFASGRVMGTLVYPNALAGAVLLLLPVALTLAFGAKKLRPAIRAVAIALTCFLGGAGFFWTGSKLGWLIAMALGGLYLFRLNWPAKLKVAALAVVIFLGFGIFAVRFHNYFAAGATSAGARLDYWRAAVQTTAKIRCPAPGQALSSGLTHKSNCRTPRWPD